MWLPIGAVALAIGIATILSPERWLRFVIASVGGSFLGLLIGYGTLPLTDNIERAYSPIAVAELTLIVVPVSFVVSFALRGIVIRTGRSRRIAWVAMVCCMALGPIVLALTPAFVELRMERNDRLAAKRFTALRFAVEQSKAEVDGPARICDGGALRRHYSGPSFSDSDWRYIVGNAVKEDGYNFYVNCHERDGYSIDARPARQKGDGTLHFCIGGTGNGKCDVP
jgi:hypothetical protein